MKRLLLIPLLILPFACRENLSTESQTGTAETSTTIVETASTGTFATDTTATEPPPPSVTGPKLMPVDEATSDPSLVAFRSELLAAVRRRDADAVVALADPKIRTSFGDDGGAAVFRRNLTQPGAWEDFETLLTQGGKFVGEGPNRSFWAPYAFSALPDDQDAFMALVITGQNVPLLESADKNARAIGTLSYDIVQRTGDIGRDIGDWHNVKTADGRSGWVEARFVRSPVGYRAGLLKNKDGKWQINALVAGD